MFYTNILFVSECYYGEVTSGSEELAGGPPENELAPSNRSLFGA